MIPVSIIQNTLSQVREFISNMKFFVDNTEFVFIVNNNMIAIQEVSLTTFFFIHS